MTATLKNITLALMLVLFASSCKKGWLDVTSGSEVRSDDQFKSESGFKDALMGVYLGMTKKSSYAQDLTWNMVDLMGQQYAALPIGSLAPYAYFQNYNYKNIVVDPIIESAWTQTYNTIANVNNALSNIDKNKSVLNPTSYSIIKGELLGLRAFLHFDLMRLYGYGNVSNRSDLAGKFAIPYVNEFKKEITPQLSYAKTFELLNKDINDAIDLLKEDPIYNSPKKPATYYAEINRDGFYNKREQRMNYYAARALQARILLWEGGGENLANAALSAEEVIKYSSAKLVNSASAALVDPALYPEHLFTLNVLGFVDFINPYLDLAPANVRALYLTNARAAELYETANSEIGLVDYRYNTLLSQQTKGFAIVKLQQKLSIASRNNMPLIRLPEMYYIAAEAYVNTNPSKSIEYLNNIRNSRGIIQNIPTTANAESIKAEVEKEYRKEFIMEGQLFFYYKRLGKTTFPGLGPTVTANDNIYLLPYPASEIEFGNRVQ